MGWLVFKIKERNSSYKNLLRKYNKLYFKNKKQNKEIQQLKLFIADIKILNDDIQEMLKDYANSNISR